jgi:hypothetical protein
MTGIIYLRIKSRVYNHPPSGDLWKSLKREEKRGRNANGKRIFAANLTLSDRRGCLP